ncbi:unnamed protein product [Orchesella dallaii]|uniref:O-acyltransferase WSD1 C-terminal domain-containing protein n=1 Tax=Orchesella dallaii TaxID=48710 RepID=A0ABP1Q390_9HEXA
MVMLSPLITLIKEGLILLHGLFVFLSLLILILLFTPIYIYRWCVIKYVACFHKSKFGKPIGSLGSLFAIELLPNFPASKAPKCVVGSKIIIDGHVTMQELEEMFYVKWIGNKELTSRYPEATQYVEKFMGFVFWKKDPYFKIENHLKILSLKGSTEAEMEEELCHLSEELLNKPFPHKRSPWEAYVVHNYKNDGLLKRSKTGELTLLILRMHHTFADGFSVMYAVIEGLLDTPLKDIALPNSKELGLTKLSEKVEFGLSFPLRFLRDLSEYSRGAFGEKTGFHRVDDRFPSRTLYGRPPDPFSVEKIRITKEKLGVSFTAVVLSVLASAMGKTLGGKRKPVEKLLTYIPLPLPGHPRELSNHATIVCFPLPTAPELDPVVRVKKLEANLTQAKRNTTPLMFLLLMKTLGSLFPFMIDILARNRVIPTGVSNFPGPGIEMRLNGKRGMEGDFFAGTLQGVTGVGFQVGSYQDCLRVSTVVDNQVMSKSEVKQMVSYVVEEFDKLYELAMKS